MASANSPVVIEKILVARGQGFYYYEDIQSLQRHPLKESDRWTTKGSSPGFEKVREIGETLSLGLRLSNGRTHWGDAVSVSYGGKSGRDPLFRSEAGETEFLTRLAPLLQDLSLTSFRELGTLLNSTRVHRALAYGVSQALLFATADAKGVSPMQLIAQEWGIPLVKEPVPLQGSSGNDRYDAVDKMIASRLEILPHGQIDDIEGQLGSAGEKLLEYGRWIVTRLRQWNLPSYTPLIHFDVHGAVATIFSNDVEKTAQYLRTLKEAVAPYPLQIESVAIQDSFERQLEWFGQLKTMLADKGIDVPLFMDEWANTKADIEKVAAAGVADGIHLKMPDLGSLHDTIDAVLATKKRGLKVLLGGSCIETEISAKASVHVAMATQPSALLVKPGMGVNEGIAICRNEMNRILCSF